MLIAPRTMRLAIVSSMVNEVKSTSRMRPSNSAAETITTLRMPRSNTTTSTVWASSGEISVPGGRRMWFTDRRATRVVSGSPAAKVTSQKSCMACATHSAHRTRISPVPASAKPVRCRVTTDMRSRAASSLRLACGIRHTISSPSSTRRTPAASDNSSPASADSPKRPNRVMVCQARPITAARASHRTKRNRAAAVVMGTTRKRAAPGASRMRPRTAESRTSRKAIR